jgi:hypothetical protein
MNSGRTVFAQLLDFLPTYEFKKCVERYDGEHRVRSFSCFDQFLCMAFAHLTGRDSLRDTVTCLRALGPRLYHAGFRGKIRRSTLADANEQRDWRIYADFAMVLIGTARELYAEDPFLLDLDQPTYAFDSTTIELCLSLFPWARFSWQRAALKLHTLLDLRAGVPCFLIISKGQVNDATMLDDLVVEPGSFLLLDRGYLHFARLYTITQNAAFFVTRSKSNLDFSRRDSRPVDFSTGVRSDQTIVLAGQHTAPKYPAPIRRVRFFDEKTRRSFVFLTNNFQVPALTIANLYKCRWQVELFFKWIKQHLRLKAFYGTSENAVKSQIWIAISVFVLVAILRKKLNVERSLAEILQVLSMTLFEKVDVAELLAPQLLPAAGQNQLMFNGF